MKKFLSKVFWKVVLFFADKTKRRIFILSLFILASFVIVWAGSFLLLIGIWLFMAAHSLERASRQLEADQEELDMLQSISDTERDQILEALFSKSQKDEDFYDKSSL